MSDLPMVDWGRVKLMVAVGLFALFLIGCWIGLSAVGTDADYRHLREETRIGQ